VDEPAAPGLWDQLGQPLRRSIIVVFWLFLGFSILYAIVSPEFRRELVRAFLLILTMVVLLPYIARHITDQLNPQDPEGMYGELPSSHTIFPQPPPFVENPPAWLLLLAKGLLLLFLLTAVYLLWYYLRPRSDARAVVARHVRQAITDLDAGLQFDDVVIACYNRMCQEFQQNRQVQRQEYMTPREFQAYLANTGISNIHIQQLTRLFEGARYGARPSDPARERQARHSLQAILQAYGE
jgi:hypothetical protein